MVRFRSRLEIPEYRSYPHARSSWGLLIGEGGRNLPNDQSRVRPSRREQLRSHTITLFFRSGFAWSVFWTLILELYPTSDIPLFNADQPRMNTPLSIVLNELASSL